MCPIDPVINERIPCYCNTVSNRISINIRSVVAARPTITVWRRTPILRTTLVKLVNVLKAEAADPTTSPARLNELAAQSTNLARSVVRNPATPAMVLEKLASYTDPVLLRAVAAHPNTPLDTLRKLAGRLPEGILENPMLDRVLLKNPCFFQGLTKEALCRLINQAGCPDWVLKQAALTGDEQVQLEICRLSIASVNVIRVLQASPFTTVREAASLHVTQTESTIDWQPWLRLAIMQMLDPQRDACGMAFLRLASQVGFTGSQPATGFYRLFQDIGRQHIDRVVLERLAHHHRWPVRCIVALRADNLDDLLESLARDEREEVRAAVASNPMTAAVILRRLADDPCWPVQLAVARHPGTPADVLKPLSDAKNSVVLRQAIAGNIALGEQDLQRLAADPDLAVRVAVAGNPSTPEEILKQFATDGDISVRQATAGNPSTPEESLKRLAEETNRRLRVAVAGNTAASAVLLEHVAKEAPIEVLLAIASNPSAPKALLKQLATGVEAIRQAVARNPTARRWELWMDPSEATETSCALAYHPNLSAALDPALPLATLEAMLESTMYSEGQLLECIHARLVQPVHTTPLKFSFNVPIEALETQLAVQANALIARTDSLGCRLLGLLSSWVASSTLVEHSLALGWEERTAIAAHPKTPPVTRATLADDGNAVVRAAARSKGVA